MYEVFLKIPEKYKMKLIPTYLTFIYGKSGSGKTTISKAFFMHSTQNVIYIIKDLSRFSRRNSRGLAELENLSDNGVRIIYITDNIDFPTENEWLQIQFRFIINEMPVTDTSKKVRKVIENRQKAGKWEYEPYLMYDLFGERKAGGSEQYIIEKNNLNIS